MLANVPEQSQQLNSYYPVYTICLTDKCCAALRFYHFPGTETYAMALFDGDETDVYLDAIVLPVFLEGLGK